MEVYSRVTGYYRPVQHWNKGKKEEFKTRKSYKINKNVDELEKCIKQSKEQSAFTL